MRTNRSEHQCPLFILERSPRAALSHMLLLWLPHTLATACSYANLHSHISLESQGTENYPSSRPPPFQNRGYRAPDLACPECLHALSPCCQMQSDHSG